MRVVVGNNLENYVELTFRQFIIIRMRQYLVCGLN